MAAARGRFNGIRQVAPVCNTTSHMLSWADATRNSRRHFDRFSRFAQLMAESLYFTTVHPLFPLKLPLRMGDLDPYLKPPFIIITQPES